MKEDMGRGQGRYEEGTRIWGGDEEDMGRGQGRYEEGTRIWGGGEEDMGRGEYGEGAKRIWGGDEGGVKEDIGRGQRRGRSFTHSPNLWEEMQHLDLPGSDHPKQQQEMKTSYKTTRSL